MKNYIVFLLIFFAPYMIGAQNTMEVLVKDQDTRAPLAGATVYIEELNRGEVADSTGLLAISNIPEGTYTFLFSFLGYESHEEQITFPYSGNQPYEIFLEGGEELEEVVVTSTRRSRSIEAIPTRIEAITSEELLEKAVMNSTNIAMLLRESTGILMQQTSANSANQSIRIQGLDGRYTQLLKDGFPLFGGFSGGLSIMQIPPLDLQQVEVIKGSSSTLYGGGAIAGLVNLVTKRPEEDPDLSLMLNQTTAEGTTLNGFYAQKFDKVGLSVYASGNRQEPFDPNDDEFSDIPRVRSLTINPRFFWYPNEKSTLWVGLNATRENRIGGDIVAIEEGPSPSTPYTEENQSSRLSTQLNWTTQYENGNVLNIKNSFNFFDREILLPTYSFQGRQLGSFSEASYSVDLGDSYWIIGANLFTDDFDEQEIASSDSRAYQNTTFGGFFQNTWDMSRRWVLESGLRVDNNSNYGSFVLPRISLLFKPNEQWSSRLGGGMGYKLPTIFTEEAETRAFQGILPIDPEELRAERSIGANFDINYKTVIGERLTFSLNQLFFFTQLQDPLVLSESIRQPPLPFYGSFFYENGDGQINSRGFETNVKFTYGDFKLFLQYAFIDVNLDYNNLDAQKPLTPRHNAGAVLVFEQHGKWRVGFESYYTGSQVLSDGRRTQDFWVTGLMALRQFDHWSFFLNFENFIDTRQTRFEQVALPPRADPSFREIWAPTDGFVVNGGFIWKLFKSEGEHHH